MDEAIINMIYSIGGGWGMALYVLVTTFIAGLLSIFIGIEREAKGQAAGLRTHVLLSVGCALMMCISIWGIGLAQGASAADWTTLRELLNYDTSRVAAGIIAATGFLSAGTIIKTGLSVRGLTTAATLWICTGIGMACGCGFILEAIIVTLVTMLFLYGLAYVEKVLYKRSPSVHIIVAKNVPILKEVHEVAGENQLIIKNIKTMATTYEESKEAVDVKIYFAFDSRLESIREFTRVFSSNPDVYSIYSKFLDGQKTE